MELKDIETIVELEKYQFHPWNKYSFEQAIGIGHQCAVVEQNGRIVGYGVVNKGHGRHIYAAYSRVALEIYTAWYNWLKENNIEEMTAETTNDAKNSIAMLERFGFNRIGIRPSFYGPGVDAVVWSRPVGDRLDRA